MKILWYLLLAIFVVWVYSIYSKEPIYVLKETPKTLGWITKSNY